MPERRLLLPRQWYALGDRGHWDDNYWTMLTVRQVCGDGAGKELLQSSPYAAAAAAHDDQLDIEDVG